MNEQRKLDTVLFEAIAGYAAFMQSDESIGFNFTRNQTFASFSNSTRFQNMLDEQRQRNTKSLKN